MRAPVERPRALATSLERAFEDARGFGGITARSGPSSAAAQAGGAGLGSGIADVLAREGAYSGRREKGDASNDAVDTESGYAMRPPLFSTEFHEDSEGTSTSTSGDGMVSKWRPKERLKTTAVALVMCLNIGVDPPDVVKISPCARLECWIDPLSMQSQKALEAIGKSLQAQYERWQPRAKYKVSLDPTLEDVKKLCVSYRRAAKSERVLFHYNGHGVPKPTINGEVWVFNKSYTQYIPLSVYDLQTWLGKPSIYVLDCSNAGMLMNAFQNFAVQRLQESEGLPIILNQPPGSQAPTQSTELRQAMQDVILLGGCGTNETLPQNVALPADLFTSCLTTPIKIALRWFCGRSLLKHEGLNLDMIDRIPGKQTDRKTLLGELNWIFTAITDTIAWNVLPRPLFQKLFRQDLLVASLFRNFLLAERIMRAFGCTPMSYPALPSTHQHPMWHAWDLAAETCLAQLPGLLSGDPTVEYHPSSFFTEQLTAFEVWLEHGSRHKAPPEQLPIVLQVLLSQSHRLRALVLLGRFLDMGTWAVELALSVGIFPYVLKLLQTTANELRQILVFIWTKILALDQSCKNDLTKDSSFLYFIKFLDMPDSSIPSESKAGAAFVLSVICNDHPKGQQACANAQLMEVCMGVLQTRPSNVVSGSSALLAQWLCLLLGKSWENSFDITATAFNLGFREKLAVLLTSASAKVRAAAVFALGAMISLIANAKTAKDKEALNEISDHVRNPNRMAAERMVAAVLLPCAGDGSPLVRREAVHALGRFALSHITFIDIAHQESEQGTGAFGRGGHRRSPSTFSDYDDVGSSCDSTYSAPDRLTKSGSTQSGGTPSTTGSKPYEPSPSAFGARGDDPGAPNGASGATRHSNGQGGHPGAAEGAVPGMTHGQLYQNVLAALVAARLDPAPQVASAAESVLHACGFTLVACGDRSHQKGVPGSSHAAGTSSGQVPTGQQSPPPRSVKSNLRGKLTSLSLSLSSDRLSGMAFSSSPKQLSRSSFTGLTGQRRPRTPREAATAAAAAAAESAGRLRVVKIGAGVEQKGAVESRMIPEAFQGSDIFRLSCRHFASPLLHGPGEDGPLSSLMAGLMERSPWSAHVDPAQVSERLHRMEESFSISRDIRPQGLDHQLSQFECGPDPITALAFDPLDLGLFYTADAKGYVTARKIKAGQTNRFSVLQQQHQQQPAEGLSFAAKAAPAVTYLDVLNPEYEPLLLAGSADGRVAVFRKPGKRACERQAASFRVVPRPGQGALASRGGAGPTPGVAPAPSPAVMVSNASSRRLYASGCGSPNTVRVWDMLREMCVERVSLKDYLGARCMACASEGQPYLLVGCENGSVLYFDLRDPQGLQALW